MNIKIITIFLAVTMFPLNAMAFGNKEGTETQNQQRMASVQEAVFYSDQLQTASFEPVVGKSQTNDKTTLDKQGQLFIEICVYITIIMVYSIYWLLMPEESKDPLKRK